MRASDRRARAAAALPRDDGRPEPADRRLPLPPQDGSGRRDYGAEIRFRSIPELPWPIAVGPAARTLRAAAVGSDAIVLDSLAAAFAAPWIRGVRPPVIAVAHQPPGGVGHGRFRAAAQRSARPRRVPSAAVSSPQARASSTSFGDRGVGADRLRSPRVRRAVRGGPPLDLRRGRVASLLCVANWSPYKGIVELLEAFATLPKPSAPCGWWARRAPIAGTRSACAVGSPRPTSATAWSFGARCRSRRSAGSTVPRTCSRSARSRTRTGLRGPRRSRPASRSSAGAPATSRASRTTGGRRSWPSPATSPAWHLRSKPSRRIGTCATDSRPARADAPRPSRRGRRRRTGSSPRSAASWSGPT